MNYFITKCWTLVVVLMFSSSVLSYAQSEQKVSLKVKNVSLVDVFSIIEKQTSYKFSYRDVNIDHSKNVTINKSDATVPSILHEVLTPKNLSFKILSENSIVIVSTNVNEVTKNAQNVNKVNVSGTIVDFKGEPVVGATIVSEQNKALGTMSDNSGNFNFSGVIQGTNLLISCIGYKDQVVKASPSALTIILSEDATTLDGVVVVGYGSQRKRDVTTSISSIKASDIQNMPTTSLEQSLVGRMAGVQITQPNGTPGAGFQVKVRGVGTVTAGSSPLYVIDGVPLSDDAGDGTGIAVSPLNSIEPSDIESIEVLKDASAAAIYGSRGSNGVVIITTKRGKEGKPIITYNGYVGAQEVSKIIDVLDAYEYAQLVYEGHNASYYDQLKNKGKENLYNPNATNQERWDNLKTGKINENQAWMLPPEILPYINGKQGLVNTNWQDAVLRTGLTTKHNLSVSGGNQNIKYMVSGIYQNETGVVIGSDFNKFGLRAKLDLKYGKWKFGGNINVNRNEYSLVNSEGRYGDDGVLSLALGAAPIYPIYDEMGNFNYQHYNTSYGQSKLNNPIAVAKLIEDKMATTQTLAIAYAEYEFIKNLNLKSQFSYNSSSFFRDYYRPALLPTSANRTPPSNPTAESRTKSKYSWVWENTLSYKKEFNSNNSINFLAGWTAQRFQGNANRITATDLPMNDLLHTIPGNATAKKFDSNRNAWSLLSGLARIQYNHSDKYLLSAAIRTDGSSRFGKNNRWGYFPSLSAAWYISDEEFMKPMQSWLSNLKLRASWGITGNMSIGDYASYGIIEGVNYVFAGSSATGAKESSFGNPDLGWEKTSQFNIGAEFGFFHFLNLEVDVYKGTTSDMLLDVPVMEASGFSTVLKNIGQVENKGIEITLSTKNTIGKVQWTNSINYSMNRNKVKSLGGALQMITTANNVIDFITEVGQPIGNYYTYVTDGVYNNQTEIDNDIANGIVVPKAKPGDFRFKKFGKDNTINADDKQITGNYMPDFTYGYSTNIKYHSFDFSLALQGVYGNEIANINRRYLANMEGNANQLSIAKDRWVSETNTGSGSVYRANRSATGMNSVISNWHIEDGSYMRIREITLGYTFNKNLLNKLKISNLRMYVSAFNPFTFTKYTGYNPEVSLNASPIMQGVDYGTYPLSRSFVFGVNFSL